MSEITFRAGDTYKRERCDVTTAGINTNEGWRNRIEVHGVDAKHADGLRDRVLLCLTTHDELVEALRSTVDGTLMRDGANRNDDGLRDLLGWQNAVPDGGAKAALLRIERRIRAVLAKVEGRA